MLLFPDKKKVKKFFNILTKLERFQVERYKGYNKKNPDWIPCSKEIFINRTIHKWFAGKSLIYYAIDSDTHIEYKQYISITRLAFKYNWSQADLDIYFFDYSQPQKGIINQKLTHNEVISAEGKWCINTKEHEELVNKFLIDEPLKKFIFKTFTSVKRGKPKEGELIIEAKTLKEAYRERDKIIKDNFKNNFENIFETKQNYTTIGDLIENY